jgi:cytochrome c
MHLIPRRLLLSSLVALTAAVALPARAGDTATKEEAVAMVKKTIAYYKANGKDKTIADINAKGAQFVDRDLYVYVATLEGVAVAHAVNPKIVGKNMGQLKDANGFAFVEDIINHAKSGKSGWVDYKWPNPITKVIDDKTTYYEAFDGHVFCAGVYR